MAQGQFKFAILFISFIALLLVAFNREKLEQSIFGNFFSYLSYPAIFLNHKIKILCEHQGWCLSDRELQLQNQELRALLANLLSQNVALIAQSRYWQEHQELIEFSKRYDFGQAILSQVFFRNLSSQEQYMLLNQGLLDGVQLNMVAVYKNQILGKVVAIYPHYCRIDLITSNNCKVAVYDAQTGAVGICCGCNDSKQVTVNYISHLQKIACEDLLISSGDGATFPQGFSVGKINHIGETNMYHQATAALMFDLATINSCYLIAANQS